MQHSILSVVRIGILFCIALSSYCVSSPASEFKAILYESMGDITRTGNIYVKGPLYQMEQTFRGEQFLILVDQKDCRTKVFSVGNKEYIDIACDDRLSLKNDPFQALKRMIDSSEVESLGLETVNGYECEKSIISYREEKVATQWVSPKLNFPIKIVNHILRDKITELRDIEEGPVDDSLFRVPAGYEKTEKFGRKPQEPPELPEWADQVPSAQIMDPPFEVDISPGDIIRVKVQDGWKINISGESTVDGISAYTVLPFLNGRNTKNPERGLVTLSNKKTIRIRSFGETTEKADEIVIRMREGKVTLEVTRTEFEPK